MSSFKAEYFNDYQFFKLKIYKLEALETVHFVIGKIPDRIIKN